MSDRNKSLKRPFSQGHPPAAAISGVLVLDKPLGLTSMRAVEIVRRRAGGARTGHAGTLDPLATGVLVLAIGGATKLIDQLMATDKRYLTTIDLGAFTNTDDAEGEREEVAVANPPSEQCVRQALERFRGTIQQAPPAFSAVKIGGRRAYKLARAGKAPQPQPRAVTVHSIHLLQYAWPFAEVSIHCEKGFYVRSLARDLGLALETGGYCASIRRTAVGPFSLDTAVQMDALPERIVQQDLLSNEVAMSMLKPPA